MIIKPCMCFIMLSSQSIVDGCTGHFGSILPFSSLLESSSLGLGYGFADYSSLRNQLLFPLGMSG